MCLPGIKPLHYKSFCRYQPSLEVTIYSLGLRVLGRTSLSQDIAKPIKVHHKFSKWTLVGIEVISECWRSWTTTLKKALPKKTPCIKSGNPQRHYPKKGFAEKKPMHNIRQPSTPAAGTCRSLRLRDMPISEIAAAAAAKYKERTAQLPQTAASLPTIDGLASLPLRLDMLPACLQ